MKKIFLLLTMSIFMPVFVYADTISCSPTDINLGGIETAVNSSQNVYEGPSNSYKKIINRKATAVLGGVHFHQIDVSTVVKSICSRDGFTYIKIISPSWLTHVEGWVDSSSLRKIKRDINGNQIFEESDFHWDSESSKFKKDIVDAMNYIVENNICKKIDPYSLSKSSKSTKSLSAFYIVCDSKNLFFNIEEAKDWANEYKKIKTTN